MSFVPRNTYRFLATALLALSPANSALAAGSYLKIIPASALAFGAVNNMGEANDKIRKLANIVQGPPGTPLDEAKRDFALTKGLDETGAAGFILLPAKSEKDTAPVVVFAAITDPKEFLANFEVVKAGEPITEVKVKQDAVKSTTLARPGRMADMPSTYSLAFRGGYAVMSPERYRAAVQAALDAKQDVSADLAGMESWLAENDGIFIATAAGIKTAAKQAEADLKNTRGSGAEMLAFAGFVGRIYGPFFSQSAVFARDDVSLFAAGVRLDKQGSIHVAGRARLVGGGKFSKAVTTIPPARQKLFADVPGGPFIVAAGGVAVPDLVEGFLKFFSDSLKKAKPASGMSDEDLDRFAKQFAETIRQARALNFVMKPSKRDDPSNMYVALDVHDSGKLLDLQEKNIEIINKLLQDVKDKPLKSIAAQRLEIAGKRALQQEVNLDVSNAPASAGDRAMLDMLIGLGGKILIYNVATDEHSVLVGIGVPQERMAAGVDLSKQPKRSLAEDPDVSLTSAMLPADAQWVAYLNMRGYVQLEQRATAARMKSYPGGEGYAPPEFPKTPPVGFAISAKPAELRGEIAVPAAVIQATGDYDKAMQQMWMNRTKPIPPGPAP